MSWVRLSVLPVPEDNSKLLPLSIASLTDIAATLHGWISQWYRKSPALLNVYWKNEFAVAGIIPELKTEPASEALGDPLVTVLVVPCRC